MFTVIKQDLQGQALLEYQGEVVQRFTSGIIIEAIWTREAKDLGYTRFETGDRFTEYFYTDRWFNIFAVTKANGESKGWYCNIATPASITDDQIEQIDLFLDVWVDPTGKLLILDEDEFAVAPLSEEQRIQAQQGLEALLQQIRFRQEPFSSLPKIV